MPGNLNVCIVPEDAKSDSFVGHSRGTAKHTCSFASPPSSRWAIMVYRITRMMNPRKGETRNARTLRSFPEARAELPVRYSL